MLRLLSTDDARRLYQFFAETQYTQQGLREAFGTVDPPLPQTRNLPHFLYQTREPTAFNTLIRWFFMGIATDTASVRRRLPGWFIDVGLQCGLLMEEGKTLVPTALIVPYGRLLIASDLYQRLASNEYYDFVLTLNPTAQYLLNFTIRQPVESTLDLGAGCGIQALAAASHSREVVATDLNPRATAYAAFNARLNGFENIRCVTGNLWAPVQECRFDRIICNPPFVLAPCKRFLYRDNDMELDGLCRRIVREAPHYLKNGGFFQMICEWVQLKGQAWQERINEWCRGIEGDVWVLKNHTKSPDQYAQTRLRETVQVSPEEDATTYAQWMDYYQEKGVEAVHGGLIALRRRSGPHWFKIEEPSSNLQETFGDAILRGFAARDFSEAHSDQGLLSAKLRLSPQVRLEQHYQCLQGHWQTQLIRLYITGGLGYSIGLDGPVAEFLARFDGKHSVDRLIQDLAATVAAEAEQVKAECLRVVRLMLERGVLLP